MKKHHILLAFGLALLNSACDKPQNNAPATPITEIPAEARDYFNHMGVNDSGGSKGQIQRSDNGETLWFDSVRTLLTYLHLPETANQPLSAWVSVHNNPSEWIAVDAAWYVHTQEATQIIGKDDYLSFASEAAAKTFARAHQGKILRASNISAKDLQL